MNPTSDDLVARVAQLEQRLAAAEKRLPSDRVTIVLSSRDFDRVLTAFLLATAAAAMGSEVSLFCAFWGLTVLKKKTRFRNKPITGKMLAGMLPAGPGGTSAMNMMGIGPAFFRFLMKKKNVQSLDQLMDLAREAGVRMIACSMSMDVMGIEQDELIDTAEIGGVTACLGDACDSRATFFIG